MSENILTVTLPFNHRPGGNAGAALYLPIKRSSARVLDHMRTSLPRVAVFVCAGFFAACSAPRPQAPFELPVVVIAQTEDYPLPGRDSNFPGGLVAAMWRDGHMIRSTSLKSVGKSYIEGIVPPQQRDAFFSFLSTGTNRAPKIDGFPLHVATQSITIRSSG